MSRAPDQVLAEALALLPGGWAWDRGPATVLAGMLRPLAEGVAALERLAEDCFEEVDPRTAQHCIGDFERVLGPDPCGRDPATMRLADRQQVAHMRWTNLGGASIPYFVALAARRGVTITIRENRTSQCGVLECGDELVESPEQFIWRVELQLGWWRVFRTGESVAGDLLYDYELNDIECEIRRLKPAHTEVVFVYLPAE